MIARIWRATAGEGAEPYRKHVTGAVFPALEMLDGYRGGYVLRRVPAAGIVEFVVITLWDSIDAVRPFAGPAPEVAVVEPAAREFLLEYDTHVAHFDVLTGPDERRPVRDWTGSSAQLGM